MGTEAQPLTQPAGETIESLASKIKAKYPDYQGIDDHELVQRVTDKHPIYRQYLHPAEQDRLTGEQLPGMTPTGAAATRAAGVTPQPKTALEQSNIAKPYYGFSPSNLLEQAKQGVTELATGAYGMGKDILFPEGKTEGERISGLAKKYIFDPADAENKKAQTSPTASESIGHSVAAAIPIVGPWAASLGEQAGTGDVGGAAARGASQVLAGKTVSKVAKPLTRVVAKALPSAADVGLMTRTDKGTLKPAVREGARIVGVAAGHISGVPGGEIVGALGAPALADALIPKRPFDIPVKQNPGGSLPAADEFYSNRGEDIEARGKAQDAIDRKARSEAKTEAAADVEARKPVPVRESPYWTQNKAKQAAEAKAAKVAPVISRPGEGGGPRFSGNEGSPARWTNERVMELAKQGNREAIQQAVRRGMELPPNARYVAGDADFSSGTYNPRDVTSFGPDGTPIRQGGRVSPVATPFSGAKPGPEYAYRVHDAGAAPEDFDMERSHAHATTSPEEAADYQQSRNEGTPQAISRTDVSSLKEGVDYEFVKGPRGNKWVRFKTPRAKGEFVPYEP